MREDSMRPWDGQRPVQDKLGIPRAYLRRMRAERPDLYDANVNGWLHGLYRINDVATWETIAPRDARSFLVRGFRTDDADATGIARALLSPNFKPIDNLDVLLAALEAMRSAGVEVEIESADLSERKMSVKVVAPHIAALAPVLLRNYRRPWAPGEAPWETQTGRAHGWLAPDDQPVVFAGYEIGNSETGGSAFTITPRLMIKVCLQARAALGLCFDYGVRRPSERGRIQVVWHLAHQRPEGETK